MMNLFITEYDPKAYGWRSELSDEELDAITSQIVSKMKFDEKIRLMGEQHQLSRIKIGLGMLFKLPLPYKAGGNKRFRVPPILFTDGPRGVTFTGGKSTTFPVSMARGASWDMELERRIGEAIGKESRAANSNYSGAVCMNLLRHPAWGRAQETYGEDSWHVGEMASALVQGIQRHNVLACIKHFAANNIENSRYVVSANMDERTLREVYLPHFKKCIDRGAMTVMSAYNRLNGEYCGHNKYLLTDILRKEWNFKGNVTSDWDNGIYDTVKPIKAGMNVEMSYARYLTYKKVKQALKDGLITEVDIDRLVYPTIRTQIWLASRKEIQQYDKSLLQTKEHIDLALEAAEKSTVLLKNENNFLPLDASIIRKVAVVGSLATVRNTGDKGSSWTRLSESKIVSPYDGIRNHFKGKDVLITTTDGQDIYELKRVCSEADVVVICVGMKSGDEGEFISMQQKKLKGKGSDESILTKLGLLHLGGDRNNLTLDTSDIHTIKVVHSVNKNNVVCLTGGSAITVEEWYEDTSAILQTFYSGMQGGNALANILFGKVNPSGKLPFVLPVSESDLPPFDAQSKEVEYGYYHGYAYMDKNRIKPRFPFGFGLSYTTFSFSNLALKKHTITPGDELEITVDVENTGKVTGAEVVQLYIGFSNATVDRPVKLLRGFSKIMLNPQQKQTLKFKLSPDDLTYYNPETKAYEVENMEHEIYLGNTSEEMKLLKTVFKTAGF